MKLKLDFVSKQPKVFKDNEVILIKSQTSKNKIVKSLNKFVLIKDLSILLLFKKTYKSEPIFS